MAVPEKSLANLRPKPFTSESAREAGRKSGEARRKRAEERKQAAEADLRSKAYKRLNQLLDSEDETRWPFAIREGLDRVEGKPVQKTEVTTTEARPFEDMSTDELRARLAEHNAKALEGGASASSIPNGQSETP